MTDKRCVEADVVAELRDGMTIGIVAFFYAGLFSVEGVGLWRERRWAEYLTIVATASLVPFEVYEIVQHPSWPRVATLGVNLLAVGYLTWRVMHHKPASS